jgi:molecular chaperone GrpE
LKQFLQVLEKYGVKPVGEASQKFDPNYHEAIGTETIADIAAGHITKVLRKGYVMHDKLLRAALVMVNS